MWFKQQYCIDCDKPLGKLAQYNGTKRCKSCENIRRHKEGLLNQKGINHWNYKIGKPKCIICDKELSAYHCKYCLSCYYELLEQRIGNKNSNWQGGISKLPYPFEFDDELKELIRKRNNYVCQNCGMTEEEHLIFYGTKLTVHHIDYNKENCKENNLIALCDGCNLRANWNKIYWQKFYKEKIYGKYSNKTS